MHSVFLRLFGMLRFVFYKFTVKAEQVIFIYFINFYSHSHAL